MHRAVRKEPHDVSLGRPDEHVLPDSVDGHGQGRQRLLYGPGAVSDHQLVVLLHQLHRLRGEALVALSPPDGTPLESADHLLVSEAGAEAHVAVHRRDPQTFAYAMADSPAGLGAWLWERREAWCDGEPCRAVC